MRNFTKYFILGALLALPMVAFAGIVNCAGIYPPCCNTCASQLTVVTCANQCDLMTQCGGNTWNDQQCKNACLNNCPGLPPP